MTQDMTHQDRQDLARSVTGVILAGGQSRRMGGGDKGLLDLAGRPMLAHVIERLAPQVGRLVINANGDPSRFAAFGLPVVADTIPDFAGPLAGVLTGMRWSRANAPAARWIATAAGDAPLLPRNLVERCFQALGNRPEAIALAQSAGELHPVIGLWPVALADDLETQLGAGVRKVLAWTDRHGTVPVPFPFVPVGGVDLDPFFNANTPQELADLRAALAVGRRASGVETDDQRLPTAAPRLPPVIGVAGWKNSGKTTLVTRLVTELTRRGFRVATVKHAHHNFQIDDAETDSARHRRAGAAQVAIVSPRRWAVVRELRGAPEPSLDETIGRLEPADLVIVEGYKAAPIPKIEVRRLAGAGGVPLAATDPNVIAVAADHACDGAGRPVFQLDDAEGIADFIVKALGIRRPGAGAPSR
jgi:molybdenum cofactor guanylyltransferase/molybdopterin-guanine dinucleotide biosynthesis protein MobB